MNEGAEATLAGLRQEIDRIDSRMHELLMERGSIIDRLIATKGTAASGSAFRPQREAAMMRVLAERHAGRLPFDAAEASGGRSSRPSRTSRPRSRSTATCRSARPTCRTASVTISASPCPTSPVPGRWRCSPRSRPPGAISDFCPWVKPMRHGGVSLKSRRRPGSSPACPSSNGRRTRPGRRSSSSRRPAPARLLPDAGRVRAGPLSVEDVAALRDAGGEV